MAGSSDDPTASVTIELTRSQVQRLDELCADRNLSRGELIGELVEHKKLRKGTQRGGAGRQDANPWGQVWPG